jgi:hypothetical protein
MNKTTNKFFTAITSDRFTGFYTGLTMVGYSLLFFTTDAAAQGSVIKDTAVQIFNVLYGILGVVGGVACLVHLLSWKMGNFLGREDPKKAFVSVLIATGLGFSIVGIIQFVKNLAGSRGADIGSL